ncbi:hypothetical protein Bca101_070799 [Brassica carinata]
MPLICSNGSPLNAINFSSSSSSLVIVFGATGVGGSVLRYGFGGGEFGMDELELPSRLFETGCEPTGKKRVNNYFNLRWIEVIKSALEDEDLAMLIAVINLC